VERRSFLASLALLGVDLTALAPTSSAQAVSAGERAVTVDGALIRDLDLTTAAYERIDHLPEEAAACRAKAEQLRAKHRL
jgi:hypothetical protein